MHLPKHKLETMFDDFIDEISGEVTVLGMPYCASKVLSEVDPIAYRCEYSNWLDSEVQNGNLFEHKDGEYYTEEEEESDAD